MFDVFVSFFYLQVISRQNLNIFLNNCLSLCRLYLSLYRGNGSTDDHSALPSILNA